VAHFPLLYQVVHDLEHFGHVVSLGGQTVELYQVQSLHFQVPKAPLHERGEVLPIVPGGHMGIEPAADLGGDVDRALALVPKLPQEPLALSIAVDVRVLMWFTSWNRRSFRPRPLPQGSRSTGPPTRSRGAMKSPKA